jgi:type VII secretion-associated protein (TIGR03931 family)
VTVAVVEVGPATIRGPNRADMEWVSAAIAGIDDALTLIDDRPVGVADVWRTVMHDVVGGSTETVVVVCPTGWPSSRVERVRDAAGTVAHDVVVRRRAEALRDGLADRLATVVEIAPEFVIVSPPGGNVQVVMRGGAEAILAAIPMSMAVLLDGPEGVEGAGPLIDTVADRLRHNAIDVTIVDRDWIRRSVEACLTEDEDGNAETLPPAGRLGRTTAVLAGTLVSAAVLCGGFAVRDDPEPPVPKMPMTLLVEGRVGVMVPAQWRVQRVTSGPGSARVQVVSPGDANVAVHITQSSLASHLSHEQVAESLRSALSQEPDGVFVEFNPTDRRADQTVVTYREIRTDHHIAWFVVIDESLRIAIGCQSAPGDEEAVHAACDQAVRSAHAVF